MGVDGLYGRSVAFERVVHQVDAMISRAAEADCAEIMRFPPAMSRRHLTQSEFLVTLPHLAGCIHSFQGDDDEHYALLTQLRLGQDWSTALAPTKVALSPAACYPVYPVMAERGAVSANGHLVDVCSYCFRHEPSIDPTRMQMFRMREFVCLGTPSQTLAFRQSWLDRGKALAAALCLPSEIMAANDPFFGKTSKYLADSQRGKGLKFELLVRLDETSRPTACMSFNYHESHFGRIWELRTTDGLIAHTACVGFGLERLALALFRLQGLDPDRWPSGLQAALAGGGVLASGSLPT